MYTYTMSYIHDTYNTISSRDFCAFVLYDKCI